MSDVSVCSISCLNESAHWDVSIGVHNCCPHEEEPKYKHSNVGAVTTDSDDPKSRNDIHGYLVGDVVSWSTILTTYCRTCLIDTSAWHGGDESSSTSFDTLVEVPACKSKDTNKCSPVVYSFEPEKTYALVSTGGATVVGTFTSDVSFTVDKWTHSVKCCKNIAAIEDTVFDVACLENDYCLTASTADDLFTNCDTSLETSRDDPETSEVFDGF